MLNITGNSLKVNSRSTSNVKMMPSKSLEPIVQRNKNKTTRINNNIMNKTKIVKNLKKQIKMVSSSDSDNKPKHDESNKFEKKTTILSVLERATLLLDTPINEYETRNQEQEQNQDQNGFIRIKFNHYNKEFPIKNSVLKWSDVDDIYCFSFIYKGNYRRDIQIVHNSTGEVLYTSNTDKDILKNKYNHNHINNSIPSHTEISAFTHVTDENQQQQTQKPSSPSPSSLSSPPPPPPGIPYIERDALGIYFIGLRVNDSASMDSFHYRVDIEEDFIAGIGAEGLELKKGPIVQQNPTGGYGIGEKKAINLITDQLKQMAVKDLHSQEALNLREQRDLEDILYS